MQIRLSTLTALATALLVLLCFPAQSLAEQVLCMRKNLKANNQGRVNFRKAYTVRADACTKREVQILTIRESADILSALSTVDGAGSGLDADQLDGMDSSSFGSASDVSTNQTNIASNTGNISSNSSSISSVSSDVTTAQADILGLGLGDKLVRVGTENAEYTTLDAAISFVSSQTRNSTNRWVILLGPGTHTPATRLDVPSFTTIRGFGKTSTIITASITNAAFDSSAAVLTMGESTALEDLQVINTGAQERAFGVFISSLDSAAELDETDYSVRLDRVIVKSRGSASAPYAVWNDGAHLMIRDSELSSGNGVSFSTALLIDTSSVSQTTVRNSTLYAVNDVGNCTAGCAGVANFSNGELEIVNSKLESAEDGITQFANGDVIVRSSEINAASNSAEMAGTSDLFVSNSTLEGSVLDSTSGTISCVFTANLSGAALGATCS